jgi:ribonuclease BN (tRNA processing enzyme)
MLAVTVLGCSGSYAAPGGACTGYLMQSPQANVWLDAGPGTLANLQTICTLADLDAVVLTHAHPDHWLELPVVANAIEWYEPRPRLPVYSNAHMAAQARALIGPDIDVPFDWRVVEVDEVVDVADQRWSFAETDHYVPTFATRVDSGGHSIVFTADTGPRFSLEPMVERHGPIDLALIESTFLTRSEHPGALHLAPNEAGQLATDAGVRKVVLTHQAPLEDRALHLAKAQTTFSGEIVLAEVGEQYAASTN